MSDFANSDTDRYQYALGPFCKHVRKPISVMRKWLKRLCKATVLISGAKLLKLVFWRVPLVEMRLVGLNTC